MDATLYIQRLKEEITTLKEDGLLAKLANIEVEDADVWTEANGFSYTIDEEN